MSPERIPPFESLGVCCVTLILELSNRMERRSNRLSEEQWSVLLDFLEVNPNLARGYNNTSQGRRESARLWQEVANALNAMGSGATKSPKEWSIYVSNYKSKLKKIVAENNADASGTGGGPPRGSTLSDHDTRFLAILGPGFGQAAARVRVNPFSDPVSQPSTTRQSPTPLEEEELNIILELEQGVRQDPTERPAESIQDISSPLLPVSAEISPPPLSPTSGVAPPLPRRQRRTRIRSRPLAPLDEAQRILSQVERQRAAADAAQAEALHLIGQNLGLIGQNLGMVAETLGRLASAAERYVVNCFGPT